MVIFLFGLGWLVIIAWAISLLGHVVFGRKHQRRKRSPNSTEQKRSRETSAPSLPVPQVSSLKRAMVARVIALNELAAFDAN